MHKLKKFVSKEVCKLKRETVTCNMISYPLHGKQLIVYIYFWELLLVVVHYDLYQPEESLSSNRNQ